MLPTHGIEHARVCHAEGFIYVGHVRAYQALYGMSTDARACLEKCGVVVWHEQAYHGQGAIGLRSVHECHAKLFSACTVRAYISARVLHRSRSYAGMSRTNAVRCVLACDAHMAYNARVYGQHRETWLYVARAHVGHGMMCAQSTPAHVTQA